MFNPLTPDRLVAMLSALLLESAGWQRPLQPFQAAQLMSASSIGKFLAAELAHGPAVVAEFEAKLVEELERAGGEECAGTFRRAAEEVRNADGDTAALGGILVDLLRRIASAEHGASADLRERLHGLLRELADREVAFLADAAAQSSRKETR
ncbi:MAG: hypothetical protein GEV03_06575 [Streptosporangiales bacterium]|nr:hypothetical protein [Streptosporangiales bacterium]